jgi:hypothetical protein
MTPPRMNGRKGIQPLLQLFLRMQFALHWAVQTAMAHVRPQSKTELSGTYSPLMRIVGAVDRPKFA